ncbi:non-ribosomal peptide synthetase [Duganella callida]|uniref:Amino acid adenylation domain-containing protein n=1 Tax=Duganella callida TaxID=2561932 RepID=A0A4Y9SRN4_9BURK|nr:non-ribosomal peptide synthetase [Duganella callida]TFW29135.1 amino acid adenylation domain-containing protein [Duganella callida]
MSITTANNLSARKRELLMLRLRKAAAPDVPADAPPPILPADRNAPLPLSFAQQRLWFLDQLDHAASAAYHMPAALRLRGRLDQVALKAALDRIIARHESLRTRFADVDGQTVQVIADAGCGLALAMRDLSGLPADERDNALAEISAAEAVRPFDLATGPLIRGQLLRLAEDDHVLMLTQHHIVSDGWSIGILVREFSTLYAAFSQDQDDPLPPLAIQYADYAAWQRSWLQGEVLQQQSNFWKEQLGGAPALLELPTDRPRPAQQSYAGGNVLLSLDAELTAGLKALSQKHGTTLFMTLLAGWATLLARLSGQDDVVVGTPVANRQRSEMEGLIGFFVNTLALRVRLDDNPSVAQLLARVKAHTLNAYQHQDLPFEQVVEAVQPARSMGHSPLFQVMLNMNNAPEGGALDLPGLQISGIEQPHATTQFDLSLTMSDTGRTLAGAIEYASDLFDETTIVRLGEHLQTLLRAMVADDQQGVGSLALLSAAQRRQVLDSFNQTDADWPRERLIHQLFEAQAAAAPGAPALVHGDERLSYAELNLRANRLAHHLRSHGIQPDERVAICMERGVDMVIAMLAVLKAGGAYVPLDPSYPAERLAYMLLDSAPVALLTHSAQRAWLTSEQTTQLTMVTIDDAAEAALIAQQPSRNPAPADIGLAPQHLAYIIYTSGSTGRPKGVMVEHRNVVNFIAGHIAACGLGAADKVLQFASFAFDASVGEIFPALSAGATLVLRPADMMVPDMAFADLLERHGITVSDLPTAFWHQWVQEVQLKRSRVPAALRLIIAGGEKTEQRHLAAWLADPAVSACRWLNTYGPTETTVTVTAIAYDSASVLPPQVPIGRPNANTRIYILDRQLQPVPVGVAGEIHVGGDGVARGYLHRPELTAERFIADPFSGQPGARLYKTGDLGRWKEDGSIEYMGRNDFQVKIRGFRIELGEIEARLAACAGVKEALVIAREDTPGDKRLVAYLLAHDGTSPQTAALRDALALHLADYMIPSAFVVLDAFPLTPTNKIDRVALPAPDASAVAARAYVAPEGDTETAVAAVWRALLKLDRVGRHDHFFELGGHSLLAVQLMTRLRQELGIDVPLRALFASPTLAAFAAAAAGVGRVATEAEAIPPADRSLPLPLSFAQQRLWFLDQLDHAASVAYHMPTALRLRGPLDRKALKAALNRVVARHESLRTSFALVDGAPVQHIAAPSAGFALAERDLSHLSGHERECALRLQADDEAVQPFDLGAGPLIRGQLLRLADDEHVLMLTQHHIVSDGWSIGLLVREISTLYAAFSQGRDDPLPPLAIQYADYAAWQRGWLRGEVLQRQSAFWKDALTGAPALLELPTDHPRPAQQSYAGGAVALMLDAELTAGLDALSRKHGATLFMTLLTGWATLLARLSGQDDVVVGTPVANRQRTETESLIGFFVNTLALRVRLDADPSVAQLLARVKAHTLGAYEHQDLPFEQVVEAVQPERSMSHSPLFQVMLNLDNAPGGGNVPLGGLELSAVEQAFHTTQFDISLNLTKADGVLVGSLRYASDLFEAATMERIAGCFRSVLTAMVADDTMAVSRLPLLSAAQRHQVLEAFNDTAQAYPDDQLLHQVFEQQAALTPEAVALVYEGESLSYDALNRRANRLAHQLRASGLRPDARVAICMERSIDMVVGLFAILKAGAAYVPLDPGYPAERLAYMLEDAGPAVLLTQRAVANRVRSDAVPAIVIDGDDALRAIAAQPDSNIDAAAIGLHAGHLAYMIYTSGSTGLPKGALNEHRAVVNRLHWMQQTFGLHAGDRVLQKTPFSFDVSVWEFFWPLMYGAALVIARPEGHKSPAYLAQLIDQAAITTLHFVPSMLQAFVADCDGWRGAGLKRVFCSGEALPPALCRRFLQQWPQVELHNLYGPTEAAVDVTWQPCAALGDAVSVPIGRPIANTRIYILDRHLQPVPVGVSGEIYIAGVQVGRGYLNRPQLTAERFVADPYAAAPDARMYKTGDLGRWLADGAVEYLGRNDFQVKLRGFRIELGEIEARLAACTGVREAVVVARDERLVAYVTARDGAALPAAELRAQLAQHLAEFMIPSAFVVLDALPLSPNGKLERKLLPAPDRAACDAGAYEAPQGEVECALAALWQELLGLDQVGRHDRFFALGGHSLLAVQLVSRLRQVFGVEIGLRALFAEPTLAALAQGIASAERSAMGAIVPADRSLPLPLSWAQQRLWFLDQLDPTASAAYHIPLALKLTGALDVAALQTALDRIVARHEALRTSFARHDGRAVQIIAAADVGFVLEQRDLSALSGGERQFSAASMAVDAAHQPFDLARGPLARGRLLRLAEQEHILLITLHHIVADGWSLGVLINELAAQYAAACEGRPDPLPALAVQYADYAAWQRQWLQGERLQAQIGYWKQQLGGAPALLTLPTDRARPAVQGYAGGVVPFSVPAETAASLRALSQRHGATLFMTVLSAWAVLLARLAGQSEVVIGVPVANRQRAEVESLIGFFVNTLALRVRLDDDPGVAALLAQVKAATLGAYAHQDLPFDQVVEALQPPRSMSHSPIFQAMLNMNTVQPGRAAQLSGLRLEQVESEHNSVHFDLSLMLTDDGQTLQGGIAYASDLFDEATVARFGAMLQTLLQAMADTGKHGDQVSVGSLSLLDPDARRQVLAGFNRTSEDFGGEQLLHRLFEAQAALRPDAPAVICEDETLSFGELNRRANRLAHALRAHGVRPDSLVALCADRSAGMFVGLLGILKAGGAYVPMDPQHPQERLAYVLEDCAPVALVTSRVLAARLPACAAPMLLLEQAAERSTDLADEGNPQPDGLDAHHLAYVIYTSGSTGNAKGVMVEHHSAVNFWHVLERTTHRHCTPFSTVALNAAYSFDMSLKGILQLLSGRCVALIPQLLRADGPALLRFLARHRVEAFDCTPSQLSVLLVAGLIGYPGYQPVSVLIGGEPVDAAMWQTLGAARDIRFYNMYGPTECTVDATICQIREAGATSNIGWPIANLQLYILDPHGQPVPPGVAGELHIGGAGVARGYLGRAALTAERFLPDPFSVVAGARIYKTGDLGRWLADGRIEYLGRNDFQVKIRGFRIELGEIEAKLAACDGVREVLVLALDAAEGSQGGKRLVAYLTAQAGAQLSGAALRAQLSAQLADYMVPAAFVVLEAMPLNANGKVDRKALPAPDAAAFASRAYVAPRDGAEQTIAALWQELLGAQQVGRHDHFFELGGHSLLAVRFVARLREQLGVELPLRDLFAHPTVEALAGAIASLAPDAARGNLVTVRAEGGQRPLFLVHPGEGEIGYAHQLAPWLDAALPVYGLAATGLLAGETPELSVEAMAASYLRQIRAVQPEGPYRLAGWSAGGTIAYEMARQLIGADQGVEFLGLIDTRSDYHDAPQLTTAGTAAAVGANATAAIGADHGASIAAAAGGDFDTWLASLAWVPAQTSAATRQQLEQWAEAGDVDALLGWCQQDGGLLPPQIGGDVLRRYLAVRHAIAVALRQYERTPIPVRVTLFAASGEQRGDPSLGWHKAAAGRVTLRMVGGDHYSVMEQPWIAELGAAVSAELARGAGSATSWPELDYAPRIPIQNGRPQVAPLFCVPGAGASVTAFAALAQAVDGALPIHGLQPRGLCGTLVPHIDVPSAARAYVKAIRAAAPHGPYRLLGHSFGGWVALETARQLVADGDTVAALVILDSDAPSAPGAVRRRHTRTEMLLRLVEIFELNALQSLNLRAADFAGLGHEQQLRLLLQRLVAVRLMPPATTLQMLRGIVRVFETNLNTDYQPAQPYLGPVHLVAVAEDAGPAGSRQYDTQDLLDRWSRFAPDIRFLEGPGNHMTLLQRPHIDAVAAWLQPLLKDAK